MANEHEDSLPDDPPEEINLDDDDLDDLLGGKEKNEHSDADADDDLLSDEDLLEADSSDEDSGEEDGAEISEEELDSLLADADSPAEELSADELDALLADDDGGDATDVLGEDDLPPEPPPEIPDSLPEDIGSDLEDGAEKSDSDTDVDTEALLDESEEEDKGASKKPSFKSRGKGKKKGFAAKDKEGGAKTKKPVGAVSKSKGVKGKKLDFICSECYSVLALSATYSEEIVTCPECFHVGKKPDDSFLRTVSTAKAGERKKAMVLTLLSCLLIVSFSGIVFLNSAYGDAAARTEADQAAAPTVEKVEGAEEEAEEVSFAPSTAHENTVDNWYMGFLISGGIFLLLLIWQACVYEGNRWEAYF